LFGVGRALTGACPGPLVALVGNGVPVMLVATASGLAGTWVSRIRGKCRNTQPLFRRITIALSARAFGKWPPVPIRRARSGWKGRKTGRVVAKFASTAENVLEVRKQTHCIITSSTSSAAVGAVQWSTTGSMSALATPAREIRCSNLS
jgi:hypothetical protein